MAAVHAAPQTLAEQMAADHAERRFELARQVGRLTGTIKVAIAALETGSSPESVATVLRGALEEERV